MNTRETLNEAFSMLTYAGSFLCGAECRCRSASFHLDRFLPYRSRSKQTAVVDDADCASPAN